MKKIVSALLVAGLLVILLVVGGTGRHRVINVQNEPEQITGEKKIKDPRVKRTEKQMKMEQRQRRIQKILPII